LSLGLAVVTLVAALLAGVLLDRWGESLLESSERLRAAASRSAAAVVFRALGGAEASLRSLEAQASGGVFDADKPLDVERALFSEILAHPDLAEANFTRASQTRSEPDVAFASAGRWQVSVFCEGGEPPAILTTHTHAAGGEFVVDERTRSPGGGGSCARGRSRASRGRSRAPPRTSPSSPPRFTTATPRECRGPICTTRSATPASPRRGGASW